MEYDLRVLAGWPGLAQVRQGGVKLIDTIIGILIDVLFDVFKIARLLYEEED